MLVYAVTDSHWLKDGETLTEKTEEALKGGATFVQLREKEADEDTVWLYVSYLKNKLRSIVSDVTITGDKGGTFTLTE